MTLKELLTTTNPELQPVSIQANTILARIPSRLRYRREDLRRLFREQKVMCAFSTCDLKLEVYQIQGYKDQPK